MSELRFDGRTALVTGAGGGIGRAHAMLLASRGANVVVNDYSVTTDGKPDQANRGETVAQEIRDLGGEAVSNGDSVAEPAGAKSMVDAAIDSYGQLDVIVNNAGINASDAIEDEPGPAYAAHMAVHLEGPLMTMRAAWDHFKERGYGRILNTSSAAVLGFVQPDGTWFGSYAIAKAGVLAATRQIAGVGEAHNIQANAVLPLGFSRMVEEVIPGTTVHDYMRDFTGPELVAAGAMFLVHEECDVSGQAFSISGGRVARLAYASPLGFADPGITPEKVRDNWAAVMGASDETHRLEGWYEAVDNAWEYDLLQMAGIGANVALW